MLNEEQLGRAERIASDLKEATTSAREVLGELRGLMKDFSRARHDGVKIVEAYQGIVLDERPAIKKMIEEVATGELQALGVATRKHMEEAVQRILDNFDEIANMLTTGSADGKTGDGNFSLHDVVKERSRLKTFAGEPITAAAEPMRKGSIVVVDGVEYEVGTDVARLGTFLYLNKNDKKLYPGPDIIRG